MKHTESERQLALLGQMIREARKRHGISQDCLASAMRISSYQMVSSIERGKMMLPFKHVNVVSHILCLDREDLIKRCLLIKTEALIERAGKPVGKVG